MNAAQSSCNSRDVKSWGRHKNSDIFLLSSIWTNQRRFSRKVYSWWSSAVFERKAQTKSHLAVLVRCHDWCRFMTWEACPMFVVPLPRGEGYANLVWQASRVAGGLLLQKWRNVPAMCRRKEDGFSSKHWKDFSHWAAFLLSGHTAQPVAVKWPILVYEHGGIVLQCFTVLLE